MTFPERTEPRTILRSVKLRAPDETGRETMVRARAGRDLGDYTGYMGVGSPEWVREHGNKVHFEMAESIFGGIERERYRE